MISDEMRELLSAYVDGELRGSDAVRIEALCKRDPAIRREVVDYRKLRARLRAWDEADHPADAPMGFRQRMVEQAHAQQRAADRLRDRFGAWLQPLPIAAGLLVATALGVTAAVMGAPASVQMQDERAAIPLPESEPTGSLRVNPGAESPPLELPASSVADAESFRDVMRRRLDNRIVNGHAMSDDSIALQEEMKMLVLAWERRRAAREPMPRERRTVTAPVDPRMTALMAPLSVVSAPLSGLVLLRRPQIPASAFAAEVATTVATDADGETNLYVSSPQRKPLIIPAGTVWVGALDKSYRTRIATRTSWLNKADLIPTVWADTIEAPRGRGAYARKLSSQPIVLGPRTRQALLTRSGKDQEARAVLQKIYGSRPLHELMAKSQRARERTVTRLMRALEGDGRANGFVIFSKEGNVLGAELFGSRALMLEMAPRLLHGYLLESGPVSLKTSVALQASGSHDTMHSAQKIFEELMATCSIRDVAGGSREGRDDWPKALRRVNFAVGGTIRGHGLVFGDRPVHVTLFP